MIYCRYVLTVYRVGRTEEIIGARKTLAFLQDITRRCIVCLRALEAATRVGRAPWVYGVKKSVIWRVTDVIFVSYCIYRHPPSPRAWYIASTQCVTRHRCPTDVCCSKRFPSAVRPGIVQAWRPNLYAGYSLLRPRTLHHAFSPRGGSRRVYAVSTSPATI